MTQSKLISIVTMWSKINESSRQSLSQMQIALTLGISRDTVRRHQRMSEKEFEVNVLDIKRTAAEKLVSLLRHSLADDYILGLKSKIRHFYDLHFLWQDEKCKEYLLSDGFIRDFHNADLVFRRSL